MQETEGQTNHSVSMLYLLRRYYWMVIPTVPELTTW
jgi:hypothetical protein